MDRRGEVTALLNELGAADNDEVLARLLPLVYDELRLLARHHRFRWRDEQSPGTVSLVHEAYLKLVGQSQIRWQSRAQFFYLASRAMRSVLIDNARRFLRQKRGGSLERVALSDELLVSEERSEELVALDEALTRLQRADDLLSRIVDCRFFGGLTIEESADALGKSPATVKRGWTTARAWLYHELKAAEKDPAVLDAP
jgi:RNA polymerase sigma factor (TIGR02999 family)